MDFPESKYHKEGIFSWYFDKHIQTWNKKDMRRIGDCVVDSGSGLFHSLQPNSDIGME